MTLAANALQAALYTRLAAQLTPVPVYDYVPQDAAYPYIVLGAVTSIPWDTKTADGQEFTVTIHAFTKAAGKKAVQTIAENIYAALHHQEANITPSGNTVTLCRCEFNEAFQDPPPEGEIDHYFHAAQRYRVLTQNT